MSPFGAKQELERGYYPFRARWARVVHIYIFLVTRRNVWPCQRRNRRSAGQAVDRRPGASGQKPDSGSRTRTCPGLRITIVAKNGRETKHATGLRHCRLRSQGRLFFRRRACPHLCRHGGADGCTPIVRAASMTVRTSSKTVNFAHPFLLKGVDRILAAGSGRNGRRTHRRIIISGLSPRGHHDLRAGGIWQWFYG